MDQESFRKLLQAPRVGASSAAVSRGSLLTSASTSKSGSKTKTISASEPAFKPRKLKKAGDYRDRAAERRVGEGNDFAQVEAVLEDFERTQASEAQDKETIDAQRAYLGGDAAHTILVKGLDVSLFEQNKARLVPEVDDDTLEAALEEAVAPKKRTREDIVRELKAKRAGAGDVGGAEGSEAAPDAKAGAAGGLEGAKRAGKFKPIGFKPIGAADEKKKKRKEKEGGKEGDRKKKKRKVDAPPAVPEPVTAPAPAPETKPSPVHEPAPEPEIVDEDMDIFADAGEYEGVDLGEDDDDADNEVRGEGEEGEEGELQSTTLPPPARGAWFASEEAEAGPAHPPPPPGDRDDVDMRGPRLDEEPEDGEEDQPPEMMRLVPLASSAIPSIRDLLDADRAPNKKGGKDKKGKGAGKDRERDKEGKDSKEGKEGREKKEGKEKEKDAEKRAERDYKKLKEYTDKKAARSAAGDAQGKKGPRG
ncbi:hypothetical protein FIBSPDRAFT_1041369 [Athelia psychrophila]|uniref:RED-like N-terminal domain-containing protein n=1 Tax=Athelia psychrophila TaxID=1759441 RepID=A0A166NZ44_9AGAM|nr:hypothetical protein FIBSPDRAFT_1041369 [Fibularhizoctonia sp. CBS 109695]